MRKRMLILSIIAMLLLLGIAASAALGAPAVSQASSGYHLTSRTWQAEGRSTGSGYQLQVEAAPSAGSGCCCLYLPCLMREH